MGDVMILSAPDPPRRRFAEFSPVFVKCYEKRGRRTGRTPHEFAKSGGANLVAGQVFAKIVLCIRFNHRNFAFEVDPQHTSWFFQLRTDIANEIKEKSKDATIEPRRIRIEDIHYRPGGRPISDSNGELDRLSRLANFGLRIVVLDKPEGRIGTLTEKPRYEFPRDAPVVPGTFGMETSLGTSSETIANEVKSNAIAAFLPIAKKLLAMKREAPDGFLAMQSRILGELYAPNNQQMSETGTLRACLQSANCPDISATVTDLSRGLAKRCCAAMNTVTEADSMAEIGRKAEIRCACVFENLYDRACAWGRRRAPRHCCPVLESTGEVIRVAEVCAPLGDKLVAAIETKLISKSYSCPYTDMPPTQQPATEADGSFKAQSLSCNYSGECSSDEEIDERAIAAAAKRACYRTRKTASSLDFASSRYVSHHASGTNLLLPATEAAEKRANAGSSSTSHGTRVLLLSGRPNRVYHGEAAPAAMNIIGNGIVDANKLPANATVIACPHCDQVGKVVAVSLDLPAHLPLIECGDCDKKMHAVRRVKDGPDEAAKASDEAVSSPDIEDPPLRADPTDAPTAAASDAPEEETPAESSEPAAFAVPEVASAPPQETPTPAAPLPPSFATLAPAPVAPNFATLAPAPAAPVVALQVPAPPVAKNTAPQLSRAVLPPPPFPARHYAAVRVLNSSRFDITFTLTPVDIPAAASRVPVSVTVPADGVVDIPSIHAGHYRESVSDGGRVLIAQGSVRNITQRNLHSFSYQSNNTVIHVIAHAYMPNKLGLAYLWNKLFHGGRVSADGGIFIVPSAKAVDAQTQPMEALHIRTADIGKLINNVVKYAVDDFSNEEQKFLRFTAAAPTTSIGKEVTITRDAHNLNMEIRRPDGSTAWAPIEATIINGGDESISQIRSVAFVIGAPVEHVVAASVRQ